MKKLLSIILVVLMLFTLVACGGENETSQDNAGEIDPVPQGEQAKIEPAKNGVLTIAIENAAIVVNETAVSMPYSLGELEAAGVPADESRREIELAAGDFYSINLFLDENEDYLICPAYYNGGEDTINIADAQAEEITMVTYSSEPVDQGVSILDVTFGMAKSDVKAMLGEPMYDNGDYFEWEVTVSDAGYKGNFSIYFTDDADNAGASQIDLTLIEE